MNLDRVLIAGSMVSLFICSGFLVRDFSHEIHASVGRHANFLDRTEHAPRPFNDRSVILHIWKLADLYVQENREVSARAGLGPVPVGQWLEWTGSGGPEFHVQISDVADFTGRRVHLRTRGHSLLLREAFPGTNYWRVSGDGYRWSEPAQFRVQALPLAERVDLAPASPSGQEIRWRHAFDRTLVEISRDANFAHFEARLLNKPFYQVSDQAPGTYFVRARGVSAEGRLTEYSPVTEIQVRARAAR